MRFRRRIRERGDDGPRADLSDAALVTRALRDPRAFELLFARHFNAVFAYCYRGLGVREDADDATNQIMFNAYRALGRFRDEQDSFRAWLFTIAHHEIGNRRRHTHRHPESSGLSPMLIDAAPATDELALVLAELDEVRGLLARLPERPRQVVELRLAGLDDREIAAVLGISYANARKAGSRAAEQLRRCEGGVR